MTQTILAVCLPVGGQRFSFDQNLFKDFFSQLSDCAARPQRTVLVLVGESTFRDKRKQSIATLHALIRHRYL